MRENDKSAWLEDALHLKHSFTSAVFGFWNSNQKKSSQKNDGNKRNSLIKARAKNGRKPNNSVISTNTYLNSNM